jgi:hypothetical protein
MTESEILTSQNNTPQDGTIQDNFYLLNPFIRFSKIDKGRGSVKFIFNQCDIINILTFAAKHQKNTR